MSKVIKIYDAKQEDLIYLIRNGVIKLINMTSDPEDHESLERAFATLTYAIKVSSNSMFGQAETVLREVFNGLLDDNSVNNIIDYSKSPISDFELNILKRIANIDPKLNDILIELMMPIAYVNGGIDHILENKLADILGIQIKNSKSLEFLDMR